MCLCVCVCWSLYACVCVLREDVQTPRPVPAAVLRLAKNARTAVGQATARALADGLLWVAVSDDFPVTGPTGEPAAYAELSEAEAEALERIAAGRLHALGWALGTYAWDTSLHSLAYASPTSSLWAPVDADHA
jgi:hypothetical protein